MIAYLLKVIACSAIFYAFYFLLLSREKMLVFNRFYLLGGILVSFFIPLITIGIQAPVAPLREPFFPVTYKTAAGIVAKDAAPDHTGFAAVVICILISLWLLARFCVNLYKILTSIRDGGFIYIGNVRVVLSGLDIVPHSFLSTVFLNRREYSEGKIEAEVLEHELAHIRQRHSWDILFVELLQVICWFNPFIYLYKRSIKINHELLADAAVIKKFGDVRSYQTILLQRAAAQPALAFASSFNFFITKKRLIMLHKKDTIGISFIKSVAVLPVILLSVLLFHQKTFAEAAAVKSGPVGLLSLKTPGSLEAYEKLLDKYGLKGKSGIKDFDAKRAKVSAQDLKSLTELFIQLTPEEKEANSVRFLKEMPPFEKVAIAAADLNKWKDGNMYGLWIDDQRVSNSVISKYAPADFSHVFVSKLSKNAKNYGKHYYQVDLMTNEFYNRYRKEQIANKDNYIMILVMVMPRKA